MSIGVEPAQRSVIIVGPALGDHIDDGCRIAAVLRRKGVGLNSDLLDGVGVGRQVRNATAGIAIGRGAIDGEIVRFRPLAVGVQVDTVFGIENIRCRLRISLPAATGQARYPWRQHHQTVHIASNQRQFVHLRFVDLAGDGP